MPKEESPIKDWNDLLPSESDASSKYVEPKSELISSRSDLSISDRSIDEPKADEPTKMIEPFSPMSIILSIELPSAVRSAEQKEKADEYSWSISDQ